MNQQAAPTLTAERRANIVEMVARKGAARVKALAAHFSVDDSTIRRDLQTLEEAGKIRRVHGGAVSVDDAPSLNTPAQAEDARIGQAVARMVSDGETIFLGPGKLTLEVARFLSDHAKLTIVTNGLGVAHWVAANTSHTLIVTGGQVVGNDNGLAGQLTRDALSTLRADRVIVELGGVSVVGGLTDDDLAQAEIARILLEIGTEFVVLVPVERVGRVAATYVASITDADVVVTRREAPSAKLWDLSESGVRVVLA